MSDTESESLIEFPCDFPIKVMGAARDDFVHAVVTVVRAHAPDFDAASVEMRASGQGNYLAVTCTVRATSRAQLDNLYRDLSSHPYVKIVL
jgi:putative lipoic acid-binding regulatory protein